MSDKAKANILDQVIGSKETFFHAKIYADLRN